MAKALRTLDALLSSGRPIFSVAIIGLGVETLLCARVVEGPVQGFRLPYNVIPIIPWLPPVPWLAYFFGAMLVVFGAGLLSKRKLLPSAQALGVLLFLSALILDVSKYAAHPASGLYRTRLFEPIALACFAWLLPGREAIPSFLERAARYLLALSLISFGITHYRALAPIGTLIPDWIPWHVFWIAFFGAGFIATGISLALNILVRWSTACLGLMYALWVSTLHIPSVLKSLQNPDKWSSLLIAISFWGGAWALSYKYSQTSSHTP